MKDKLVELLGGLPFFLMVADGTYKLNKTRIQEGIIIGVIVALITTISMSVFALPMAVRELKSQLTYIEKGNVDLKIIINDLCKKQESMQQDLSRINVLQQERIRKENKGR